jgi:hypothetical protein
LSYAGTLPFEQRCRCPAWNADGCRPRLSRVARAAAAGLLVRRRGDLDRTHGRVHVKPPFVDRFTQTPLVSSVRLKLICA